MNLKFNNDYLEALFEGETVKGKPKFSRDIVVKFRKTVLLLRFVATISDLYKFKGLHFEALRGDLQGFYSVRVDIKYRLILRIEADEISLADMLIIEDLTKHYA